MSNSLKVGLRAASCCVRFILRCMKITVARTYHNSSSFSFWQKLKCDHFMHAYLSVRYTTDCAACKHTFIKTEVDINRSPKNLWYYAQLHWILF